MNEKNFEGDMTDNRMNPLDVLNTMSKEAKEIEKMNAKIKRKG